jgi:hypothetical protein
MVVRYGISFAGYTNSTGLGLRNSRVGGLEEVGELCEQGASHLQLEGVVKLEIYE